MQRVALIGLGAMGSGMAANWLKRGFPLTVYNRSRKKAVELEVAGARFASTPREAALEADVVLAMVSDDYASRDVWLGDRGALAGAKRGTVVVESSTVSPRWVRELSREAEGNGLHFLDAPVGGSKPSATAGTLTFFVGGDAAALDAVRPVLEAVSAKINHLGDVGAGTTWKLVNNWLIAAQVAALAEAMNFAFKAGFSAEQISSLVLGSSSASPIVEAKLPRMLERRFDNPDFALGLMYKDARYALDLAQQVGLPLDMLRGAVAAFSRAEAKGLAASDFAAVAAGNPA